MLKIVRGVGYQLAQATGMVAALAGEIADFNLIGGIELVSTI